MDRPNDWVITVNRISIASEDVNIDLTGVELSPANISPPGISVNIDRATVSLATQQSEQPQPVSWHSVIQLVINYLESVPLAGRIEQLSICDKRCFEGDLSWFRRGKQLRTHFKQVSSLLQLQIAPESLNLSLTGHDEYVFLLSSDVRLNEAIHLTGSGWFQKGSRSFQFQQQEPVDVGIDLESMNATFSGSWPRESIIAELQYEITGEILIDAKSHWRVQLANTRFLSEQPIGLTIKLDRGATHSNLNSQLDVRLENPYLDSSLLSLSPGLSCSITPIISCISDQMVITSHEDIYDTRVELTNSRLALQDNEWQVSADADVSLLENNELIFSAAMGVAASNEQISASSMSAEFLGVDNVVVNITHSFITEKGLISTVVDQPAEKFMGLVDYLALNNFELLGGTISINNNLDWNLKSEGQMYDLDLKILIEALDLEVGTYRLLQGTLDAHLGGWGTLQNRKPAIMTWQHIDIGVPVENTRTTFDMSLGDTNFTIFGQTFDAEVLGGRISSHSFNYDVMNGTGAVNLILDEVELNQILALQQEDFESSGKISGSVPVQIDKGKLSVSKGTISAIEPGGYIKYKPGQTVVNMLTENEQLKVVVETMQDFQYDKLIAELEYSPEGQLVARTSLQGSNPAYENGREVHLNIKLEENIAALLESLRLGDDLTRKIGEKNSGVRQ
jgi:hypothetical protein